jgi:hypothetical protein
VIVITFGSFLHVCITRLRFIRRSLSYGSLSFNNGTYAMAAAMSALRLRHSSSCALRAPGCSSYLAPPSRVVCLDAGISRGMSLSACAAGSAAHILRGRRLAPFLPAALFPSLAAVGRVANFGLQKCKSRSCLLWFYSPLLASCRRRAPLRSTPQVPWRSCLCPSFCAAGLPGTTRASTSFVFHSHVDKHTIGGVVRYM